MDRSQLRNLFDGLVALELQFRIGVEPGRGTIEDPEYGWQVRIYAENGPSMKRVLEFAEVNNLTAKPSEDSILLEP